MPCAPTSPTPHRDRHLRRRLLLGRRAHLPQALPAVPEQLTGRALSALTGRPCPPAPVRPSPIPPQRLANLPSLCAWAAHRPPLPPLRPLDSLALQTPSPSRLPRPPAPPPTRDGSSTIPAPSSPSRLLLRPFEARFRHPGVSFARPRQPGSVARSEGWGGDMGEVGRRGGGVGREERERGEPG
ncbi:hypothetical protein K523DRAFT_151419 [Schizophyllum commune Tattone D]|nr:hypothetical protein K523DRAFT_151419 [Schizophyllum commune Tattone D]